MFLVRSLELQVILRSEEEIIGEWDFSWNAKEILSSRLLSVHFTFSQTSEASFFGIRKLEISSTKWKWKLSWHIMHKFLIVLPFFGRVKTESEGKHKTYLFIVRFSAYSRILLLPTWHILVHIIYSVRNCIIRSYFLFHTCTICIFPFIINAGHDSFSDSKTSW